MAAMKLTDQETAYLNLTKGFEMGLMGAGVGGGFINTQELHVVKYNQAMKGPDKTQWEVAMKEEYNRMIKNKVWKAVPRASVPKEATILSSTWAMKKKASGIYRARLNAHGYEQFNGEHFDKGTKASPVVGLTTIMIILILMVMAGWYGSLTDVHGAFLKGNFGPGEQLHMHVPQGLYYGSNVVLLLLKTIYGLVQSAYAWWRIVLAAFGSMGYERSKVDPCLFYKWTERHGLQVWMTWINDSFACGTKEAVSEAKKQLHDCFKGECDDGGELQEYVGCKIEYNRDDGWI
jgi:Reverse transcriptase (RNA-dependent DNA polymerase)